MIDLSDLVAATGVAPRVGQVATRPVGAAGWSKQAVGRSPDLRRILALPRRKQPDGVLGKRLAEAATKIYRRENTNCRCHAIRPHVKNPCITDLRVSQAWALMELANTGGIVGSIGVGHGKTLLDILAPLAMPNCKLALLLCIPGLVNQLIEEYELISEHFRVPRLIVHNSSRYSNISGDAPILHVMPFSRLSRKDASEFIDNLRPDFILVDEVQKLKDPETATTSRVIRYFENHQETRFAGWTGTLTDKSLKDFGHISTLALRENSPLPVDQHVLAEWAGAVDPSEFPSPAGALFELCEPGETIQSGLNRRLVETKGFVATRESAIAAHLVITQRKSPPIPEVIKDALSRLRDAWQRPDGEELVEAFDVAKSARELACGFFYRWKFVNGETESQINKWLELRKAWNTDLRERLRPREPLLDSPLLCQEAAVRAWGDGKCLKCDGEGCEPCNGTGKHQGGPEWKCQAWPAWRDIKSTVKPITEAVRLDPFLAIDASDWGHKNKGIIWYSYSALGEWIAELSCLPLHTGGPKAAEKIAREKGDRSIIASINSHGTGRDGLQRIFTTQLITSPPSSASTWEQLLGRLHRVGFMSDKVTAEVYRHTIEFRTAIDRALGRAAYVQDVLGAPQKLKIGY